MEQHGIFYYFTHTSSDHTMVIADTSAQLPPCAVTSTFTYASDDNHRRGFYAAVIETFNSSVSLVTGQHTFWDYRFSQYAKSASSPATSASKATLGDNAHEFYDYAEANAYLKTDAADGNTATLQAQFQNVSRDRTDTQSVRGSGRSNAGVLQPGTTFTLSEFPRADANIKYLTTRVEHRGDQRPSYRTEAVARTEEPYRNLFQVQPASLTYRPPLVVPKPRVHGVVTGKVVAPSGDESYLDKYGRVCVQFWWDRTRKPNTTDNTLLRVAQQWAGNGWGTYFWPRLGDEVLIEFLDGDPDNPIVTGSLYNGTNLPKYSPTGEYTRSGILTRSSKDGEAANANELRFDDLKGSEQIFINAEKDFDTHVENDRHTQVDNDEHLTVTANSYSEIDGETHRTLAKDVVESMGADHHLAVTGKELVSIDGDRGTKIGGQSMLAVTGAASENYSQALSQKVGMNHSLQVGMNSSVKTGMVHVIDAGMEAHIKGGMKVVIESEMEVCLSTPGGFISIGPQGVTIQGLLVMINSGGAPVPGRRRGRRKTHNRRSLPKARPPPSGPGMIPGRPDQTIRRNHGIAGMPNQRPDRPRRKHHPGLSYRVDRDASGFADHRYACLPHGDWNRAACWWPIHHGFAYRAGGDDAAIPCDRPVGVCRPAGCCGAWRDDRAGGHGRRRGSRRSE